MSDFIAYRQTRDDPASLIHHDHDCHEMVLIETGSSTFTIENRVYKTGPYSLVVIGNLERHHIHIDQTPYHRQIMLIPNNFLIQEIRLPVLASFFLYRPHKFSHLLELDEALFKEIHRHMSIIIEEYQSDRPLKEHQIGLLLEILLMKLYRCKRECFSWENSQEMTTVFLAQRYVAQHFIESLTLSEVADSFHISRYHFSRTFQAITGYGFQKYLMFCRLNEAKRLLQMTDLSVTQITEQSGYGNVNNFIRAFKKREGLTPLQFRKHKIKELNQDIIKV